MSFLVLLKFNLNIRMFINTLHYNHPKFRIKIYREAQYYGIILTIISIIYLFFSKLVWDDLNGSYLFPLLLHLSCNIFCE